MTNAILKIDKEIAENKENTYIEKIGSYLKQLMEIAHSAADNINAEDKTLKGCFEDMKSKAKAKATNGSYAPSDAEVVEIINGYFGITTKVNLKTVVVLATDEPKASTEPIATKSIFDLI